MKKFHYLYEIKNNINGKIYIGVHSTNDLNDGYFGSGTLIKKAVSKYGSENFSKTILEFFDNAELAFKCESEVVDEDFIARPDVYNLKCGGYGSRGYRHTDEAKGLMSQAKIGWSMPDWHKEIISKHHTGKINSEETRKKMSIARTGAVMTEAQKTHLRQLNLGKTHSEETRKKMSESQKGKPKHNEETRKRIGEKNRINMTGKTHSEETRKKMSESQKGYKHHASKVVICNGIRYNTITEAAQELEVLRETIVRRAKNSSPKWTNWYFL